MNTNHTDDELITRIVSAFEEAPVPPGPSGRATISLLELKTGDDVASRTYTSDTQETRRSVLGVVPARLVLAVSLAASLLVLLAWWTATRQSAWAEVVDAVAKKPWLHAVTTHWDRTGAKEGELWFSANHNVLAHRIGETLVWTDCLTRTRETFFPRKDTIVRVEYDKRDDKPHKVSEFFEAVYATFLSAEAGRTVASGPLKLVHKQARTVERETKRWIEHRFELLRNGKPSQQEWIIYVDPESRLPFRWETIHRVEGGIGGQRWDVDYPDTGPASIYTMGAPKSAEVVDLLVKPLAADVKRLLAGVVSAVWRCDRYHVLVVESSEDQHWSEGDTLYRIWRSGPRWRVEKSYGRVTRFGDALAPEDADPALWWRQKADTLRFVPYELCDGEWIWRYTVNTRSPTQEDIEAGAPNDVKVLVSIDKRRDRRVSGRDLEARAYGGVSRPELAGRYRVGFLADVSADYRMAPGHEATADPHPTSGPPDTVLLEVRNLLWDPANAERSRRPWNVRPQIRRFWIDQRRGYLVMRRDDIVTRDGQEEVFTGSLIEGVTQSPQGYWYPTIVRTLKTQLLPGKALDTIKRYYYDFDAPMPDSLFEAD